MLQILIWAMCAVIFGVGYCGMQLEKLAAGNKVKSNTGRAFTIAMWLITLALFILSIEQGKGLSGLLG
jgi:hypothetical protein